MWRENNHSRELTMTMAEPIQNEAGWQEFCERHAIAAAQDFAKSCSQFLAGLPEATRPNVTAKELAKSYVDVFTDTFETDFRKRRNLPARIGNGVVRYAEEECVSENGETSPKLQHKPFFRRYTPSTTQLDCIPIS